MEHFMKLSESNFRKIKQGVKKIEIRLFDEKRQKVQVGDNIEFTCSENNQKLTKKVTKILRADSFGDLVAGKNYAEFGFDGWKLGDILGYMFEIYSPNEEKNFGVVGLYLE